MYLFQCPNVSHKMEKLKGSVKVKKMDCQVTSERTNIYSLLWKMLRLHTFTNGMGMGDSDGTCNVIETRVIQMEKLQSKT